MRGPGRPPTPQDEQRRVQLPVYVTRKEAERLRKRADRDGMKFSAWARRALLKAAQGQPRNG
jgi:hypothetical protein